MVSIIVDSATRSMLYVPGSPLQQLSNHVLPCKEFFFSLQREKKNAAVLFFSLLPCTVSMDLHKPDSSHLTWVDAMLACITCRSAQQVLAAVGLVLETEK